MARLSVIAAALVTVAACGAGSGGGSKGDVSISSEPFKFAELRRLENQIQDLSPLEPYTARDGSQLFFRRYSASSNNHLILIHGSSGHSAYLHAFAKYLSAENVANVYTPDLRGHGFHPQRRGDIDYIGQLEDDLADLILHISQSAGAGARMFLGGHSSGGGLALRFGGSEHAHLTQGLLLLAPYLGHDAPMVKKHAGGWAKADVPKIIALSVLNAFGLSHSNGAVVLRFNLPERYQTGHETLAYSFRMMKGMHPDDYRADLKRYQGPILLIVGSEDEAFHPEGFKSGTLSYKPDAVLRFIPGVSHLGLIVSEPAMVEAAQWLGSS